MEKIEHRFESVEQAVEFIQLYKDNKNPNKNFTEMYSEWIVQQEKKENNDRTKE